MLRTDAIQITPEILSLIAWIDEFKGAWRALGTLAPDRLSALPDADHAPAPVGRIRLCAVQFARERDRTQQGSLLPCAAPDPEHDPNRVAELATVAGVLPALNSFA